MTDRPAPTWEAPEGYEHVAVEHEGWRLVTGKRCRLQQHGRKACGQPSVAELNRGRYRSMARGDYRRIDQWWAYCGEHLYANWIEDGKVMHWIVRKKES